MKPILKYRGGKSKEIQYFCEYIPKDYITYIEPFFGGGATFFYLEPKKSIINDINCKLMNFYKDVKNNFQQLKSELSRIEKIYIKNVKAYNARKMNNKEYVDDENEKLYYLLRDMFNNKVKSEYLDSTLYYFINKTAYSGMIRYNSFGEYNVPYGRYRNFNTDLITLEHNKLLKKSKILCSDYIKCFNQAGKDDFMFLDPPYDCIFKDYGNTIVGNEFNENEQIRLAKEFKHLDCKALLIIGKTKLTKELYNKYIFSEYNKDYAVNIRNRFKSKATHLIIKNY